MLAFLVYNYATNSHKLGYNTYNYCNYGYSYIYSYIYKYIYIHIYIHTYPLSWLQLHPQVPPATDSPQLWPAWCRPWRWDAAGAWTRDAPARLCSFAHCSPPPLDVAGRCERERNDDGDVFECFWGFRLRGSKENVWGTFFEYLTNKCKWLYMKIRQTWWVVWFRQMGVETIKRIVFCLNIFE